MRDLRTRQIVDSDVIIIIIIILRRRVDSIRVHERKRECVCACVLSCRQGRGKEEDVYKDLYTVRGKETTAATAAATIVRP